MLASAKTMTIAPQLPQLADMSRLWIHTASSPRMGFGHLRRSLVIAESLQDYCTPVFILDPDDVWSRQHLEDKSYECFSRGVEEAWDLLPEPAAILLDTRLSSGLNALIAVAKSRRIPVISIHDLGLNNIHSDVFIDGSIVPPNPDSLYPDTKYFTGTEYMILDPIYRILSLQNKVIGKQIRSVFVNLGGGNSGKFYWKVLKGLKLWSRELEVIGVPGFVSWGQEVLAKSDWSPLHFRWEGCDFERLLFQADLAITAGGISAYEVLCTGTPLLALSYDHLQRITVKRLSRLGACIDLGLGEEMIPDTLAQTLNILESDISRRRTASLNGRRIVDGEGASRVARIIRQSVSDRKLQMNEELS